MKNALEGLLEVIGTDEEIGTHGAQSRCDALLTSIKQGDDVYKRFKGYSFERRAYGQALLESIPLLNQMSPQSFHRLLSFAEDLEVNKQEFGRAIKGAYILPAWCAEQVEKRATFLQEFAGLRPTLYTLTELQEETQVRKQFPWQWIDAVFPLNKTIAQEEMIKITRRTGNTRPLHGRLPHLIKRMSPAYVQSIVDGIKDHITAKELEGIKRSIKRYTK